MNEEYLIGIAVNIFLNALKGAKKKAQIKKVALKVYNAIKAAYAGDPDFQ